MKWTKEIDEFIKAECPCNDKHALLELINAVFNQNFSYDALVTNMTNKRIQAGIRPWQANTGEFRGRNPCPLYAEQEKKGYIRIKVAHPNVWKMKQVYLYEQAHKITVDSKKETVTFLDGNNRNFSIDNLYLISRKHFGVLSNLRKKGDSKEVVLQKIELAKLKYTIYDLMEKTGAATRRKSGNSNFRVNKAKVNENARRHYAKLSKEKKQEIAKRNALKRKERMEQLKLMDIDEYNRQKELMRKYKREYMRRRKDEEQN